MELEQVRLLVLVFVSLAEYSIPFKFAVIVAGEIWVHFFKQYLFFVGEVKIQIIDFRRGCPRASDLFHPY